MQAETLGRTLQQRRPLGLDVDVTPCRRGARSVRGQPIRRSGVSWRQWRRNFRAALMAVCRGRIIDRVTSRARLETQRLRAGVAKLGFGRVVMAAKKASASKHGMRLDERAARSGVGDLMPLP